MDFFRGQSKLYANPKLIGLSAPAFKTMVFSWAWSADNETDGHIPKAILPILGARPKVVDELVTKGVWEVNGDGWVIHDWLDHQKSKADIEASREQWRRRQTKRRSKEDPT